MANYFQIFPPLVFSYRLFIFTNRGNFQLELEFEESMQRKTASIFKEGIGQESNGAANQEKQIFLLCKISPSASSTRDLGTRLYNIWTRRPVWLYQLIYQVLHENDKTSKSGYAKGVSFFNKGI